MGSASVGHEGQGRCELTPEAITRGAWKQWASPLPATRTGGAARGALE